MLLKSDGIVIDKDNPFKNDALGRKDSAEALLNFVLSAKESLVVCIDAPWGDGKTTFLRMWEKHLENNDIPTIYFNAWENDFSDDALVSLIGAISSSIEELSKTGNKSKARKSMATAQKFGIALLKRAAPLAAKMATAGVLNFDKAIEQAFAGFAESIAKEQLKKYEHSKKSMQSFREALSNLANSITDPKDPKPLVFIIDELDRCRPNYAIEILEKAKHFFNVDNIVFVLGAHKDQLGSSIKAIYGEGLDANGYLRRFIDFDFILPPPDKELFAKALFKKFAFHDYFSKQTTHQVQVQEEGESSLSMFSDLFEIYRLTLREQEHCCSLLSLSMRATPPDKRLHPLLLCFLIVLKVNDPDLYKKLITDEISPLELLEKSKGVPGFIDLLSSQYGSVLESYIISCTPYSSHARDEIIQQYTKVRDLDSTSEEERYDAESILRRIEGINQEYGTTLLDLLLKRIEIVSRFKA